MPEGRHFLILFRDLSPSLAFLTAIVQYVVMRALLMVLGVVPALAQVAYTQIEPQVIVPSSTQTILLQARVSVPITSLAFQWSIVQALDVPMKDDGTGGDKVAGDGIYSAPPRPSSTRRRG